MSVMVHGILFVNCILHIRCFAQFELEVYPSTTIYIEIISIYFFRVFRNFFIVILWNIWFFSGALKSSVHLVLTQIEFKDPLYILSSHPGIVYKHVTIFTRYWTSVLLYFSKRF